MTIKKEITNHCARLILAKVRTRNILTPISDESGINRKYLTLSHFRKLRFHQLMRLLFVTSSYTSKKEFVAMGRDLCEYLWDLNNKEKKELDDEI